MIQLNASDQIENYVPSITFNSDGRLDLHGNNETLNIIAGSGQIALGSGSLSLGVNSGSSTYSGVVSGTGSLAKLGSGTVTLSGANTYTGATTINAGTLQIGDDDVLSDSTAVTIAGGATFDLNNHADAVSSIAGTGQIDLRSSGQLTIGGDNSSSSFSGSVVNASTGILEKVGAGSLTFNNDINYHGTLKLGGGTLVLNDMDLTLSNLVITADSIIDFAGASSSIFAGTLSFLNTSITLNIINWTKYTDYFFATNWIGGTQDTTGILPMNQIVFNSPSYTGDQTIWDSYDNQIYAVIPEPSTYGLIIAALCAALFAFKRLRPANYAAVEKQT